MITPRPWARMGASTARAACRLPSRFTSSRRRQTSPGVSSIVPRAPEPALLTSTSTRPKRASTARTNSRTCSSTATSTAHVRCAAPSTCSSPSSARRRSARRAQAATLAPARAKARAVSRPMPAEAPVIATIAPRSSTQPPRTGPDSRTASEPRPGRVVRRPPCERAPAGLVDAAPAPAGHQASRHDRRSAQAASARPVATSTRWCWCSSTVAAAIAAAQVPKTSAAAAPRARA